MENKDMETSPLISIIIPVYNLEKHVLYSLKSAYNQTYPNVEIIAVDDGATDSSGNILDKYAYGKDKIRIIHTENGGVSAARNVGIEAVCGKYIMFLDGDDIISPKAVETLLKDLEDCEDCVFAGFSYERINTYDHSFEEPKEKSERYNSTDILRGLLGRGYENIGVCGKLFVADRLRGLKFEKGRSHNEDKYFLFQYLLNNNGVVSERKDKLYGYYTRPGSASNSVYSEKLLDVVYFSNKILEEVEESFPELTEDAMFNDFVAHLIIAKSIVRAKKYQQEKETFKNVKKSLISKYDNFSEEFFGGYRNEYKVLKFSNYLYCMCVFIRDYLYNLINVKKNNSPR